MKENTQKQTNIRERNLQAEFTREDNGLISLSFSTDKPASFGFFYETLSHKPNAVNLERAEKGALPFLRDHNNSIEAQLGLVARAWIDSTEGKGYASVRLSQYAKGIKRIGKQLRANELPNISCRYKILKEHLAEDKMNGKSHYIVDEWELLEISSVSVPADADCGVNRCIEGDGGTTQLNNFRKVNKTMSKKNDKGDDTPEVSNEDTKQLLSYGKRFEALNGLKHAADVIDEGKGLSELQERITAEIESRSGDKKTLEQTMSDMKNGKPNIITPDPDAIEWRSDFEDVDGRDLAMVNWERAMERERAITQAGGGTIPTSTEASGLSMPWFKVPDRTVGLLELADVRFADSIEGDAFYLGELTIAQGFNTENTLNESRTQQGGLDQVVVNVDTKTLEITVAKAANQDVGGLESSIMNAIAEYGFSDLEKALVTIASGASVTQNVATGAATALPNANAIVGKLAAMLAMLKSAYANRASVMVSKEVFALLVESTQGNGAGLNYDVASDIMMFNGHRVLRSDHLADGNAANEVSAVVGDLSQLVLGIRANEGTERFSFPGHMDYFGYIRRGAGVKNAAGLVKLVTKAS